MKDILCFLLSIYVNPKWEKTLLGNAAHFLQDELIEYRPEIIDAYYAEMALEEYLCFTNADSYPDMRGKCQFYKLDLDTKFGILLLLLQNSGASVNQIRTKTKSQLEETKGK